MRQTPVYAGHPELAELAALEKALNDAFDGRDAEPLSVRDLFGLTPEDWPDLIPQPHPTAIPLSFATNAVEIWSALKDETAPPNARALPEPQMVLVWRQDAMARFRPFEAEEAMMWNEASKGIRFSQLCGRVATFGGEDGADLRAASYLKNWVDMGILARP